jgi:capsular polysaccharide biosynthesis protein
MGFAVLRTGELSFAAQRRLFSNARIVVGSHGGALTNMIYSYHRPMILELTHTHYGSVNYGWYQFLASLMDNWYAPLLHLLSNEQGSREYDQRSFVADLELIADTVTLLEEAARHDQN